MAGKSQSDKPRKAKVSIKQRDFKVILSNYLIMHEI